MSNSKAARKVSNQGAGETLSEQGYAALEGALMQTPRGRAFLAEYTRRNAREAAPKKRKKLRSNASDTDRILFAIDTLHESVADHHSAFTAHKNSSGEQHVRMGIVEMAKAIARTRSEIASMRTEGSYDQLTVASEEMDAIVQSTEKATTDILQAAERIQEVAWQLREAGAAEALCEQIDNCATDIYMACSFQDLTGQRTTKVVRVLQYLEARIDSMIEIWGLEQGGAPVRPGIEDSRPDAHLLNGPQGENVALGQDNIDRLMDMDDGFAPASPPQDEGMKISEMRQTDLDALVEDFLESEPINEDKLKALFG